MLGACFKKLFGTLRLKFLMESLLQTAAVASFFFFLPLSFSDMQVVYFPNCQHSCCQDCAGKHFTIIIKDRGISEATCPFCMEPKGLADDDDLAADYFAKLDVLIWTSNGHIFNYLKWQISWAGPRRLLHQIPS